MEVGRGGMEVKAHPWVLNIDVLVLIRKNEISPLLAPRGKMFIATSGKTRWWQLSPGKKSARRPCHQFIRSASNHLHSRNNRLEQQRDTS